MHGMEGAVAGGGAQQRPACGTCTFRGTVAEAIVTGVRALSGRSGGVVYAPWGRPVRVPCEVACISDSGQWGHVRWCGMCAMRWTHECHVMLCMHIRWVGASGHREVQPDVCRHVQIVMNTSRKGKKKKKKTPTHRLRWAHGGMGRCKRANVGTGGGHRQMWVGNGVACTP